MTEPEQITEAEQFAKDVFEDAYRALRFKGNPAAYAVIQRAFEERERELREALGWYADQMCEGICEGKDPEMCALIGADNCAGCPAVIALATRQDAPKACSEDTSHDH